MKRRYVAAFAAAISMAAAVTPASSFWPVIDPTAIAQIMNQVAQTMSLVQSAKTELNALPSDIGMSNIAGRISSVTAILQQARSACQGVLHGRTLPSACQVQANTANAQAAQLGREMSQIQALQSAANGVSGGLAANQLQAKGLVEIATQLQESRQAETAAALQKQIDEKALESALHGKPSITNPYGP